MKVNQFMSTDVKYINKADTAQEAARMMLHNKVGSLPVEDENRLVGIVTDRDLAIKILAQGMPADTKVSDCLNQKVKYCLENENVAEVVNQMKELQISRMPVMNKDKNLVGMFSLSDFHSKYKQ